MPRRTNPPAPPTDQQFRVGDLVEVVDARSYQHGNIFIINSACYEQTWRGSRGRWVYDVQGHPYRPQHSVLRRAQEGAVPTTHPSRFLGRVHDEVYVDEASEIHDFTPYPPPYLARITASPPIKLKPKPLSRFAKFIRECEQKYPLGTVVPDNLKGA